MELGLIFVTGLFLSLHCVGMCGGFVALVAAAPTIAVHPGGEATLSTGMHWRRVVLPQQVVFNAGRIASYTLLGAIAGTVGSLATVVSHTGKAQAVVMIGAGLVMIATGAVLAGLLKHWSAGKVTSSKPLPGLATAFEAVARLPRPMRALPLGALLGFLPCGLIYSMLAEAAASGSPASGALVMLAFGAGTVPALLLVAFLADVFSVALRERLVRISGVLLATLGSITLYRGWWWLMHPGQAHSIMHHMMRM